jgi:glycosyltransferase involved in cell wall biosynthesis
MICAIVPVHNEESRVGRLLKRLLTLPPIQRIFVILNGSNLLTQEEVAAVYNMYPLRIRTVQFAEPLGIDVPRSVGARLALRAGAGYALFVDGDMVGEITGELWELLKFTSARKPDLALTDCYPDPPAAELLKKPHFLFRRLLNHALGYEASIGIASPSHGPHLVSRRMLMAIPAAEFSVPPTLLVYAHRFRMNVQVAGAIPHLRLGSQIKNGIHNRLIVDTVSGDCLEALCMAQNRPRSRQHNGKLYIGYHSHRRFDLLARYLSEQNGQ